MNKQLSINYDTLAQAAKPIQDKIDARKAKRGRAAYEKGLRTHASVDPVKREAVRLFHADR